MYSFIPENIATDVLYHSCANRTPEMRLHQQGQKLAMSDWTERYYFFNVGWNRRSEVYCMQVELPRQSLLFYHNTLFSLHQVRRVLCSLCTVIGYLCYRDEKRLREDKLWWRLNSSFVSLHADDGVSVVAKVPCLYVFCMFLFLFTHLFRGSA